MDSKTTTSIYLILFTLLFFSCEKENLTSVKTELDFPNCQLISEEIQGPYSNSKRTFQYEGGKLIRSDSYLKDRYSSTKLFTYDEQGLVHLMLTYNITTNITDTIGYFEFKENQLTTFIHYKTENNSILRKDEFEYEGSKLKFISAVNDEGQFKFNVKTDGIGNPIELELIEQDYAKPIQALIRKYEFDDKLNPYYRFPDFVGLRFHQRNNLIKTRTFVDGVELTDDSDTTLEFLDNGLPHTIKNQFRPRVISTTTLEYVCK